MSKEPKAKVFVALKWLIKIDKVLTKHYGFKEEEFNFLLNND